jgi:hypothetical protein
MHGVFCKAKRGRRSGAQSSQPTRKSARLAQGNLNGEEGKVTIAISAVVKGGCNASGKSSRTKWILTNDTKERKRITNKKERENNNKDTR